MRAFISAGHGPKRQLKVTDSGAVANGVREHDLAEWIARRLAHGMRAVEPHVVPRGGLRDKVSYVNRWSRPGDVAVEIHLNAVAKYQRATGAEVLYCQGSKVGRQLASELHASLVAIGRRPRGPKSDHDRPLYWLRRTRPWAALVEVAFLTDETERQWILEGGAHDAAAALAHALDNWP